MPLVDTYISDTQLFHDLKKMDRSNFSYEGSKALMVYLDELSEDIGENIEYDPIAFCCEYSEYGSYDEAASEYFEYSPNLEGEADDNEELAKEFLQERTTVIEFDGGVIIQDF